MWTVVDSGKEREATALESFAVAMTYLGIAVEVAGLPRAAALFGAVEGDYYPDSDEDGCCSLEAVGAVLGLTRERVRQIEEKAKAKIRAALTGKPYVDPRADKRGVKRGSNWHTEMRHAKMVENQEKLRAWMESQGVVTTNQAVAYMRGCSRTIVRDYLSAIAVRLGKRGLDRLWSLKPPTSDEFIAA